MNFKAIVKVTPNDADFRMQLDVEYYNPVSGGGFSSIGALSLPYTEFSSTVQLQEKIIEYVVNHTQNNFPEVGTFNAADVVSTGIPFPTFHEAQITTGVLSAEVDGKVVQDVLLYTNNSGRQLLVTDLTVITNTVTGAGTNPVISLGKTPPPYNDIRSVFNLPNNASRFRKYTADNDSVIVNAGETVYLQVTVASTRTEYKFRLKFTGTFLD